MLHVDALVANSYSSCFANPSDCLSVFAPLKVVQCTLNHHRPTQSQLCVNCRSIPDPPPLWSDTLCSPDNDL